MTRQDAAQFCRDELNKYNLTDWHIRLSSSINDSYLGLCSYKDKCIILNALHIDMHPDVEIKNTILHEIAHALCPNHQHDEVWAAKAREIGCTSTSPCSHLSLAPEIIDAIRSGADIKVEFETEVIHKPKYTVTRLQDKCEHCGKVAKEIRSNTIVISDPTLPDKKFIYLECGHLVIKNIPKGTPFQTLVSNWWKPEIASCQHSWQKNQCINCGEYKPFEFQVDGMSFVEQALAVNKGAGLFDEMGLGKTVQVLGYLRFHPEAFPVAFVVKSGLKFQILKEIIRWLGPQYIPQMIQSSNDFLIPQLKCYIISYDIMVPKIRQRGNKTITQGFDVKKLIDRGIKTIVLDECQQIKNPDSTRTQMVRRLAKIANVIGLSGTPWKNRGSELFTVLNMMAPVKFPGFEHFKQRWVDYYYHGNQLKEGGIRNIARFKEYTKDICIRRERTEVMKELPLISRTLHYVELDNVTQKSYDDEVSDFVKWYNNALVDENENSFENTTNMLARLARMRHITGLAKIPATVEFVKDFIEETGRKIVVFVHHKDVAQIFYEEFKSEFKDIPVMSLSSDKSSEERFDIQEKFNKFPCAILIASTLASGEGLNLQTCADCVMHERQWNPANEEQAEGRFIRIGQTATAVNATYATATDTVDEILAGIVERKRVQFHTAMNRGEMPQWKQTDIIKELADGIVKQYEEKKGTSKIKKLLTKV